MAEEVSADLFDDLFYEETEKEENGFLLLGF